MAFKNDVRLVARILAGGEGAVEQFISEYRQFIYAILIRYLSLHPEDADEVFQRLLFHLWENDFRDQSHSEIGEALGMTANSVGVALSRAKSRLRRILEKNS
jgi:DNA-directed RNA polymerase specialized sigma24 family protein